MKAFESRASMVGALSIAALSVRLIVAFNSGLWADEGSFLLVVNAPSWSAMLDFLRLHESHPPLFYMLMRGWIALVGHGDRAMLFLPVMIGVLMVPTIYIVTRDLVSTPAGLLAAALSALTPALVEHSSQLRPYGLLPLLALVSCYFMALAVETRKKRVWSAYAILTVLMLYTHHWAWIIAGGQQLSVAIFLIKRRPPNVRGLLRSWILAWIVIGMCYLPWAAPLLFQMRHAGHGSVEVTGVGAAVNLLLFALFRIVDTVIPSRTPDKLILTIVSIAGAAIGALLGIAIDRRALKTGEASVIPSRSAKHPSTQSSRELVATVLVGTFALAVALSPVSNLLFIRCLASLMPLALLLFAAWADQVWSKPFADSSMRPLVAVLFVLFVIRSSFELYELATRPRSNARELARVVQVEMQPTDLLIVAPEWYAASFNHYFNPAIEQVDYPNPGRSGAIDFSDVWERTADPRPLARTEALIADAYSHNRRVWAVFGPQYREHVDRAQIAEAHARREPRPISVQRVNQIRERLEQLYGVADSTRAPLRTEPLYDELNLLLYAPRAVRSMRAR